MTSAIVCGSRTYSDAAKVTAALDRAVTNLGLDTIIEGGATGADNLAREYALSKGLSLIEIKADWDLGDRAGPMRNMMMLAQKPDFVIAFPSDGPGTRHMVKAAKAGGFTVYEVK